ncbi:MAG: hypothetical protein OIF55_10600 [Amphritea sp.]|nr:hypothetical protein [Amphritea sp.]
MKSIRYLLTVLILLPTMLRAEIDIEAFEAELDGTIKSACHGYLPDMLPEVLAWLRGEIYEKSPFCEKVRSGNQEEAIHYARRIYSGGPTLDLSKRDNSDVQRAIECDNEYMCVEVRDRLYREGQPISQVDYDRVSQHCEGRYSCIQEFFLEWPRPLPAPRSLAGNQIAPSGKALSDLNSQQQPGNKPAQPTRSSGLSLAEMTGRAPTPTTVTDTQRSVTGLTLSSIRDREEQKALDEVLLRLGDKKQALSNLCECLGKSGGCYSGASNSIQKDITQLNEIRGYACTETMLNTQNTPTTQSEAAEQTRMIDDAISSVKQYDKQAKQMISKASGTNSRSGSNSSGSGNKSVASATRSSAYQLTCWLPGQSICVEYGLSRRSDYDRFLNQCKRSGARILERCDMAGPTCTQTSAGRVSVTVTPGRNANTVRQSCLANGGRFSQR